MTSCAKLGEWLNFSNCILRFHVGWVNINKIGTWYKSFKSRFNNPHVFYELYSGHNIIYGPKSSFLDKLNT